MECWRPPKSSSKRSVCLDDTINYAFGHRSIPLMLLFKPCRYSSPGRYGGPHLLLEKHPSRRRYVSRVPRTSKTGNSLIDFPCMIRYVAAAFDPTITGQHISYHVSVQSNCQPFLLTIDKSGAYLDDAVVHDDRLSADVTEVGFPP